MGENFENRFMYEVIQCMLSRTTQTERCELSEIVDEITKKEDTPFDAGYFFLYDQVQKSFKFGGIFPEEYNGVGEEIKKNLENSKCISDDPVSCERCGLFCHVYKNFIKDSESEENHIAINDIRKFKKKSKLEKYYIDITSFDKEVQSEYVFPVYINNSQNTGTETNKILHAVIVLVSFRKNNIPRSEIIFLSKLISFIITNEAKKAAHQAFHDFVNTLSNFDSVLCANEEYENIIPAFMKLYEREESDTLKQCLFKHASLWTLNDVDPQNKFLVKEKSFYFPDRETDITDITNIITNRLTNSSQKPHYFYEFIIGTLENIEKSPSPVSFGDLIKISRFEEVSRQFYDREKFLEIYDNISNDDIVVMFPLLTHIEQPDSAQNNIGLMVLYFGKDTFAYYYNNKFLEIMSHKIYENMRIVIQKTRRDIRESIFKSIPSILESEKEAYFYLEASGIIKKKMDYEYCLVYLFVNDSRKLELKTKEGMTRFPKTFDIHSSVAYDIIHNIIEDNRGTERFLDYIKKIESDKKTDPYRIWFSREFIESNKKSRNGIYSAMVIPIRLAKNKSRGIMICFNNKRNICTKEKSDVSYFSFKDYEISSIGAEVIGVYSEILNHAKKSREILKRLAHEILGQASFIMQNSKEIHGEFERFLVESDTYEREVNYSQDVMKIREAFKKIYENFKPKKNHIFNLLDHQEQAAFRVQHFADFARLENLSEINIKKESENLNMTRFLSSIINGLRLNAKKNGVFVEFTIDDIGKKESTIQVHPLFRLALWNIINNAIQYAYFGTTVRITFENHVRIYKFHVENIGIPIPDEMEESIFEENFRTKEAERKFFQGTGLGLTLAKKVVEAHCGKIKVEARNRFCQRNIFGIFEIEKILEEIKDEKKKEDYINRKSPKRREYEDFKKELNLSENEKKLLTEYERFLVYKSRAIPGMIKDYLEMVFNGNENLEILFKNQVNLPVSYVKFTIELPRHI